MCDYDGIQKGNYTRGEPIGRFEVEVIEWWIGYGGCVIWPLRMVLCLKI